MLRVDAVNPDYRVPSVHFCVEGSTAAISNQPAFLEPENVNEKPLSSRHILIHPQRNNRLIAMPEAAFSTRVALISVKRSIVIL